MDDYVKHVSDTHGDKKGKALCGVKLPAMEWAFVDVDHAFHNARYGGRLLACEKCRKVILDVFNGGVSDGFFHGMAKMSSPSL